MFCICLEVCSFIAPKHTVLPMIFIGLVSFVYYCSCSQVLSLLSPQEDNNSNNLYSLVIYHLPGTTLKLLHVFVYLSAH